MKFVILQRGLFWRANRCSYSSRIAEAGVYSEDEVKRIEGLRRDSPDWARPLNDPGIVKQLRDAKATAEQHLIALDELIGQSDEHLIDAEPGE